MYNVHFSVHFDFGAAIEKVSKGEECKVLHIYPVVVETIVNALRTPCQYLLDNRCVFPLADV